MLFKKNENEKPVERVKIERDRTIQTNLKKSLKFQKCVGALFPEEQFELLETTQREDGSPIPESVRKLDYHFRDKNTGKAFWVECRFRQHLTDRNDLQWTTEKQLASYKELRAEKKEPIYIVVGLGGFPSQPGEMFAFPVSKAVHPHIPEKIFRTRQREPTKLFELTGGNLL